MSTKKQKPMTVAESGARGGRAYARNHSPKQRSASARRAAKALWDGRKSKPRRDKAGRFA